MPDRIEPATTYVVNTKGLPDGYVPPSASLTPPTATPPDPDAARTAPDPQYAVIHVRVGESGEAWPVVERVPGGWQSGSHHYPDSSVLDVRPLELAAPGAETRPSIAEQARAMGIQPRLLDDVLAEHDVPMCRAERPDDGDELYDHDGPPLDDYTTWRRVAPAESPSPVPGEDEQRLAARPPKPALHLVAAAVSSALTAAGLHIAVLYDQHDLPLADEDVLPWVARALDRAGLIDRRAVRASDTAQEGR